MNPIKCGFKFHRLVDSNTNYLYNVIFDPGKDYKDLIYFQDDNSYN